MEASMSIFSRIADVIKANINDLLDKAENPEKMIKQMVIEMEEAVNKATLALGNAIANERSLERKIAAAQKAAQEWEQKAIQAINAGRDDLAKAALEKKKLYEKQALDLQPAYEQARQTTMKLREQLNRLKAKLEEARTRQSTLIARSQAAKAQKQIAQAFSGVGSDAFSKFEKYESKIERLEAEAQAFEELSGETIGVEEEFRKLELGSSVDAELLALKQKLGKLPPSQEDTEGQ